MLAKLQSLFLAVTGFFTGLPRMTPSLLATLALLLALYFTSPAPGQMDASLWRVGLFKLELVCAGIWLGYWADRWLFPYGRPDKFLPEMPRPPPDDNTALISWGLAFEAAMLRRAIVVAACIYGLAQAA